MYTIRARYTNGQVEFDPDQELPEQDTRVLVVFLEADDDATSKPQNAKTSIDYVSAVHKLTKRELDILRRIRRGLPNKEIAKELGISAGTVRNYTTRIYHKLGVNSRTEAAIHATELGIQTE